MSVHFLHNNEEASDTESANRAQMIPMFTLTEYRFFTVAKGTA
jgi:hypothetical protein